MSPGRRWMAARTAWRPTGPWRACCRGLLRPGGHALLEIGRGQESTVAPLFKGLDLLRITPDLAGIARCVILRKP